MRFRGWGEWEEQQCQRDMGHSLPITDITLVKLSSHGLSQLVELAKSLHHPSLPEGWFWKRSLACPTSMTMRMQVLKIRNLIFKVL